MLIGRKIVTEEDRAKALAKAREKQRKRITKYGQAKPPPCEEGDLFLRVRFCGSSSVVFNGVYFFP